MAIDIMRTPSFRFGSTTLTDQVQSIALNYEAEEQDKTVMGVTTRIKHGGLKVWSIDVTLFQNFDAVKADVTFFSKVGSATTILIRANATAVRGATNPEFSGLGVLLSYPPLGGQVGEMSMTTIRIASAGTLSRTVSAT